MSPYEAFFDAQVGRGKNTTDHHHLSLYEIKRDQTGCGIGRVLGGLYRKIIPIFKRGTNEVGKEAVRAGINIVKDVAHDKLPLKNAFKNRLTESGHNLKRKAMNKLNQFLEDKPYNTPNSSREPQLLANNDGEQSPANIEKEPPAKRVKKEIQLQERKNKKNQKRKKKSNKYKKPVADIFKKKK